MGASALAVGVAMVAPARATTLTGFDTTGADMAGMEVTVNFQGGGSDTQIWSATGVTSGGASGTDWSLTQSGDTFSNPWSFDYTGLGSIVSLMINAIPGNAVFDIVNSPIVTPDSALGKPFTVQNGLAPDSFNYSVPIDISQGDLFGKLSLFWDDGFTANNRLSFVADTDSGTTDDPVTPRPTTPEPTATLSLLALGAVGATAMFRRQRRNA